MYEVDAESTLKKALPTHKRRLITAIDQIRATWRIAGSGQVDCCHDNYSWVRY